MFFLLRITENSGGYSLQCRGAGNSTAEGAAEDADESVVKIAAQCQIARRPGLRLRVQPYQRECSCNGSWNGWCQRWQIFKLKSALLDSRVDGSVGESLVGRSHC